MFGIFPVRKSGKLSTGMGGRFHRNVHKVYERTTEERTRGAAVLVESRARLAAKNGSYDAEFLGIVPEKSSVYLSDLISWFTEYRVREIYVPSTAGLVKYVLDNFLRIIGNRDVMTIGVDQIDAYKAARILDGKKTSSVDRELNIISALFTQSVKRKKLKESPVKGLIEYYHDSESRTRTCSMQEFAQIMAKINNKQIRIICVIALGAGLRRGDILKLEREDLDLEMGAIPRLEFSKTLKKSGAVEDVPLRRDLTMILREYLAENGITSGKIFSVGVEQLKGIWRRAVKNAGISDLHFHDLRRTYISRLHNRGHVDIQMIKKFVGHTPTSTVTEDVYIVPELEQKHAAVESIEVGNLQEFVGGRVVAAEIVPDDLSAEGTIRHNCYGWDRAKQNSAISGAILLSIQYCPWCGEKLEKTEERKDKKR
jgi:integrase